jgi:hypothetical protein
VAFFPFGLRLPLERRAGTRLWEGRFLVPEGLADGSYAVRIVLRDASGASVAESKSFVLDGRAPVVMPETCRFHIVVIRVNAVVSGAAEHNRWFVVAPIPSVRGWGQTTKLK